MTEPVPSTGAQVAATAAATPAAAAPLDDVMLAMDVVDTLRHRDLLVERELAGEARDQALLARLRQVYAAQGIDVPERVLAEGVAALREDRFAYRPPPPGLATALARAYVMRARLGAAVALLALVAALAWGVHQATVVAPRQALVHDLEQVHAAVLDVATVDAARVRAEALVTLGRTALGSDDAGAARAALDDLRALLDTLEQRYEIAIVTGANSVSGVWRVPDVNEAARNYYLIVEALDEGGRRVPVEVVNEETGRSERVDTWGLRVSEAVFERVAADKRADGIVDDRVVGEKRRGELTPRFVVDTTGGAITRW